MAAKAKSVKLDAFKSAQLVSVFGEWNCWSLVKMPTKIAEQIFDDMDGAAQATTIEAVEQEIAAIAERDEDLAKGVHAALALRMAYELDNPYNSATSKAACAKALNETMDTLLELAPQAPQEGKVDELRARRKARLAAANG